MPNINLRLTEEEHAELRAWAHGSRRSLQREIVFRLFDGVLVEGVALAGEAEVARAAEVAGRSGRDGSIPSPPTAPSTSASVQSKVQDVPMRSHYRGDRPALVCATKVATGSVCPDCGRRV